VPSYRTGVVDAIVSERPGLQRVLLAGGEPAYVLTQLVGPVAAGDRVVVNTTAVELGLGTGGSHVVHWNLSRDAWSYQGRGHVMKLRYTSLQVDAGASEELDGQPPLDLDGMPVVACGVHSQLAAVTVAFKQLEPAKRLAYVMTDGAALPIVISDLVWALRGRRLVDFTVTCGQAFGGDHEAVNVHSALLVARRHGADAVVAGVGPGVVGTGTTYGHTGLDGVGVLNAATALGGRGILALRASEADERERHQGISHHSVEVLALLAAGVDAPEPDASTPDAVALFERHRLSVTTMGRAAVDDRSFFQHAAAAGAAAAAALRRPPTVAEDRVAEEVVVAPLPVPDAVAEMDVVPTAPPVEPTEAEPVVGDVVPAAEDDEATAGRRAVKTTVEWVVIIAAALVVAFVVKTFLIQVFWIPSASMEPELHTGDRVLVNKLSYRAHDVHRGDIVVFERPACDPTATYKDLIKRVIGLSGETVEGRNGGVYVDGRRLLESYLPPGIATSDFGPVHVPADHVWVMGDNRSNSKDSRFLCNNGPTFIADDEIVGRAFVRVWPVGDITLL
jgi:signal peptidase I